MRGADALQLRLDAVAGEDRRGDLGQQLRLALARGRDPRPALRLGRPLSGHRGQTADDDRRDQQHDQLHDVAASARSSSWWRGGMKK